MNFDDDVYAKKENFDLNDIQINNINELKNILTTNNVLNKWPGSYFTKIQYESKKKIINFKNL